MTFKLTNSGNAADSAKPSGRAVRAAVRWLATTALLIWLARTADWRTVGPTLATASPVWLLIAAGCYLASQFASVARWRLLVRAGGMVDSYPRLLSAYFEGMFVNLCLPTSIGGDVLKVVRIGGGHDKTTAAATVVADRAAGVIALVALLGLGMLLRFGDRLPAFVLPIAIVCLVLVELALIVGHRFAMPRLISSNNIAGQLLRAVPLVADAPWPRVIGWALIVQGLNVATVAAAAKAIGASVTFAGLLIATETASLAAALPLSVAGIGMREATLPMLLAADGVPRAVAIALGLTWSAIVMTVGLVGGIGHVAEQRRSARDTNASIKPLQEVRRSRAA